MNRKQNKNRRTVTSSPLTTAFVFSFISCISCFILIIVLISLYTSYKRYSLIGQALGQGDTGTAALLASPEISKGIRTLIR